VLDVPIYAESSSRPTGPILARPGADVIYLGKRPEVGRSDGAPSTGQPTPPMDRLLEEEPQPAGPIYARAGAEVVYAGPRRPASYAYRPERREPAPAPSLPPEDLEAAPARVVQYHRAGADVFYTGTHRPAAWQPTRRTERADLASDADWFPDTGAGPQRPQIRQAGANVQYDDGWHGWRPRRSYRGDRSLDWQLDSGWDGGSENTLALGPQRRRAGAHVDYEGGWHGQRPAQRFRGDRSYDWQFDSGWDDGQDGSLALGPQRRRAGANVAYEGGWHERGRVGGTRGPWDAYRSLLGGAGTEGDEGDAGWRGPLVRRSGDHVTYQGGGGHAFPGAFGAQRTGRTYATDYDDALAQDWYGDEDRGGGFGRPRVVQAGDHVVYAGGDHRRPAVRTPWRHETGYYSLDDLAGFEDTDWDDGTFRTPFPTVVTAGGGDYRGAADPFVPGPLLGNRVSGRMYGGSGAYLPNVIDSMAASYLDEVGTASFEAEPAERPAVGTFGSGGQVQLAQAGGVPLGALGPRSNLQLGALGGQTVSPYIGLLGRNNPVFNYFGIIQPMQQMSGQIGTLQSEFGSGGGGTGGVRSFSGIPPNFMNLGHYFPGFGTTGGTGARPGFGGSRPGGR
jgi:hypothetical protein